MYKKCLVVLLLSIPNRLAPSAGACTEKCDKAYDACTAQAQHTSSSNSDEHNQDDIGDCNDELKECYLTCN